MALRVLLLSDIHCDSRRHTPGDIDGPGDAPHQPLPHVLVTPRESEGRKDALIELKGSLPSDIDAVLVSGDLCNGADEQALHYIWAELLSLGELLDARVFSVPGNHDMDSRFKNGEDPRLILQGLPQPFPEPMVSRNDQFFARHFLVDMVDGHDVVLIRLNSAAFHGYREEWRHGRVSSITTAAISAEIGQLLSERSYKPALGIFLTHHHYRPLHSLAAEGSTDYSAIRGDQHLTEFFRQEVGIPWLLIHGHRHQPTIYYADGPAAAPTVIAAGSMGQNLTGMPSGSMNTYHVIDVDVSGQFAHPRGIVETHVFADTVGWRSAPEPVFDVGLPYIERFGDRSDPRQLAVRIEAVTANEPILTRERLLEEFPDLRFRMSADLQLLVESLSERGLESRVDMQRTSIEEVRRTPK